MGIKSTSYEIRTVFNKCAGDIEMPKGARIQKICIVCGETFPCYVSTNRVKTCSKKCGYASRRAQHEEKRKCGYCGKEFSYARYKPRSFCSQSCRYAGQKKTWERKGVDGWRPQHRSGYIVRSKQGRTVMQHREVMEKILGRPLTKYETVHHKNGDRTDNSPENLELWVKRQPPGQRVADVIEWAICLLDSQGYTVIAPTDRHSSKLLNGSADAPVKHTADE